MVFDDHPIAAMRSMMYKKVHDVVGLSADAPRAELQISGAA